MKQPRFAYLAPKSLDEALAVRAEHGSDCAPLAGGQSLLPLMSARRLSPAVLLDLGGVAELAGIRSLADGVVIGAMTRQRDAERSALVAERLALVPQALRYVAHVAIRNRGTVGGTLAHADPESELTAASLVLDAQLVARSATSERVIPIDDFLVGPGQTALAADELLTEIRFPHTPVGAGTAFVEIARRRFSYGMAGACALLATDPEGVITDARLAFIVAGPTATRATEAESMLRGRRPDEAVFHEVAQTAIGPLDPPSDVHGSAAYRRRIAATAARRALVAAAAACRPPLDWPAC